MEKYFLKNGKEVKIGDTIRETKKQKLPHGEYHSEFITNVTKESLPKLIKAGIIQVKNTKPETNISDDVEKRLKDIVSPKISTELDYYVKKLANSFGWGINRTVGLLNKLIYIYPSAALSLLVREIAEEIDDKYKDDIDDYAKAYVISQVDGNICVVTKKDIKSYKNFAAFRTRAEAIIAKSIVKDIIEDMFGDGEQEAGK